MSTNLEDIFYAGKKTDTLPFALGERVVVMSGERAGAIGWIVGLNLTTKEIRYRVEYEDGSSTPRYPVELKSDEVPNQPPEPTRSARGSS